MSLSENARQQRNEYYRNYRKKNKDHLNSYQRQWRKNNKERIKSYDKKFWERKVVSN